MKIVNTIIQNRRPLRWSLSLTILLTAVALIGDVGQNPVAAEDTVTQSVVELQTTNAPMLTGTLQAVNNGPGQQTDPHVDCGLVTYTNDNDEGSLQVRYYDFASETDHLIPGNEADSLSGVFGGRIAFTEGTVSGSQIVLFDTATQTRTVVPGFGHRKSALGGNIVAFEERSMATGPNESDLSIYDMTLQDNLLVAFDGLLNKNPAVDSSGDVIVWEACQTDGTRCDITSSVRYGPGTFLIRQLTSAAENRHPDTNGDVVVYVSNGGGENDVYIQPVTGGAATQLSIAGDQRDVRINGNLVSFESLVNGTQYDVFLYDLDRGNLYRVTNTPVNETLNDISVCNGVGRIVYAAPAADFDVLAFTFQPPTSTVNQIVDLIELVESLDLPAGTENSLVTKLQDALAAVNASNTSMACDSLTAFINEARAQSGKKLTADQATQLINSANQIKAGLGCQ